MKLRGAKLEEKNYSRGAKISFFLFFRLKVKTINIVGGLKRGFP
jgi:hypothetical protein